MSDSVQPHRQQPTRLRHPWDSPGENTGVGCHFLLQCVKVKSLSRVWLLATPWTAAHKAPPAIEFSRQEYWSGLPLPSLYLQLLTVNVSWVLFYSRERVEPNQGQMTRHFPDLVHRCKPDLGIKWTWLGMSWLYRWPLLLNFVKRSIHLKDTFGAYLLNETHPDLMVGRTLEDLSSPHPNFSPSSQKKDR